MSKRESGAVRRGFTLLELLVTTAVFAALMTFVYSFFGRGHRSIVSTGRKVDAIGETHVRFEELRQDLETAAWAWVPPEQDDGSNPLGGGGLMFVEGREYAFDG